MTTQKPGITAIHAAITAFLGLTDYPIEARPSIPAVGEPIWKLDVEGTPVYTTVGRSSHKVYWAFETTGTAIEQDVWTAIPLLIPKAKAFEDLFQEYSFKERSDFAEPWVFEDLDVGTGKRPLEAIPIGPYCSTQRLKDRRPALYVKVRDFVADYIRGHMIAAGVNDRISFELIEREDGKTLVVARNSVIIGSRWLALIDTDTVPQPKAAS